MNRPPRSAVLLAMAVAGVDDAVAAQQGGADRLELSAALSLGGLTASLGTLIRVKAVVSITVMVLIRPRPGGFAYSPADFEVMQRDIELALEHGADGIVVNILTAEGQVDLARCRCLSQQIGDRAAIFHQAFDVTPDPFEALEQLIELGFRRVMTCGAVKTAFMQAVLQCLPIFRPLVAHLSETHLIWKKDRQGGWHGEPQLRPSISSVFLAAHRERQKASAAFAALFNTCHHEHAGMVGAQRIGIMNLGHEPTYLVRCALSEVWKRHGTFDVLQQAVEAIADEFEQFVTGDTLRFRFQAQLLNFAMEPDRLALTPDLTIRRLTRTKCLPCTAGRSRCASSSLRAVWACTSSSSRVRAKRSHQDAARHPSA